jgi:hypothetical protein
MGGKNMGYITGPLQIAAGAASEFFAPGNPIGIPLITGGIGQTAGTAAGGQKGGMLGELAGGAAGGLGEGFMGMGPLSSFLGPGSSAGESIMGPTGVGQAQDVVSGATQMPANFPGGQDQWALLKQSLSGLGQQQGWPNMPSFTAGPAGTSGTTANTPASSGPSLSNVVDAGKAVTSLTGGGQQSQPTPPTPGFKGPITQSPVTQKGTAPATAMTPAVTQVPTAPKPPSTPIMQGPVTGPPSQPPMGANSDLILRHLLNEGG